MKKSIAIICEYVIFPERIGGMDRFFKDYDSALKENGYTVKWFFKNVTPFPFYKNLDIVSAQNKSIEMFFLEHSTKNNNKYNIVITHFLQPVSPFFKAVKKLMNPYIINVDHNPRPLNGFPLKKRLKNKIKGILYGNYVDKIVGVSDYTKEHILNDFGSHLKNKTITIHNGIDTSVYKTQTLDRKKTPINFIVVSHLRESKGIQDLLVAVSKIDKKHHKKFKIDIFGDGSYKNQLLTLQKKYKLEQSTNFKGNSPNINDIMCNYHYMIQPTYMECFSLSILESLASNVPVITTTVGGNLEVVEVNENGYIFNPKDTDALRLILETIIKGEKTISKNVNLRIEKEFTLQKMVANHLKLVTCT